MTSEQPTKAPDVYEGWPDLTADLVISEKETSNAFTEEIEANRKRAAKLALDRIRNNNNVTRQYNLARRKRPRT